MARIKMGKKFRTRKGRYGCYKYVNGRRVAFVSSRSRGRSRRRSNYRRRRY